MIDYSTALVSLRPNAVWALNGDTYEGLDWKDKHQTKPTKEELDAEVARLQAEHERTEYQRQRATEYPPIGDQLDALWKGGEAAAEMLAKVQAVKNKYPKSE